MLQLVVSKAKSRTSDYVCVANVHMLVEAYHDARFAAIVNDADVVTPDGMPLAKGLQLLYGQRQDRVAGMDLLPDLLAKAEQEHLRCFIYGGSEAMLAQSRKYMDAHFPHLVCGYYSPPFRMLTTAELKQDAMRINNFGAHLVFVALGCPKQEKWMASMKGVVQAYMLGIGGALPVMVGMQQRAPEWMRKASLEWLYRLAQEPKRLFKRYAVTNTLFLYLFGKSYWRKLVRGT